LPPSGAASSPPAIKRAPVGGGTLLTGAALAQRRKAATDAEAAASKSSARPVPQGRDWRNPSRPPPLAALGSEAHLSRGGQAEAVAWPANDAPLRKPKLPSPEAARYLDAALAVAVESGASDLHVHSGSALHLRIDAKLWPMNSEHTLSRENAERVIAEVLDESQWMQLMIDGDLRFAYELPEVGRFRAHAYCQERGTDIVFRILPKQLATPEKLGLTAALGSLPEHVAGLCVCSGPSGSGKTTTLATLAQSIAATRALHVVTVESPIEFLHSPGLGLIEQREVGKHVASFAAGIELAQRQGADLIVVSDLGASGALEASLRAVRGRCLVLGSLRASSSAQALSKLLHATDAQHAERLRAELAYALRLLLHQRLVPRAKGPGRVAAVESIVNSAALAQLIREDKLQQLPAVMAAGKGAGMLSLDEALDELLRAGTISTDSARRAAQRRDRFKST
jgi:twitching motility protein PilT